MRSLFTIVFASLFISCASDKGASGSVSSSSSAASEGATSQGLGKFQGGYKMVTDKETGFAKPVSTKAGPFSEGDSPYFKGSSNLKEKQVAQKAFDMKRWNGEKNQKKRPWSRSNEQFEHSPHFIKQNSDYMSKTARASGKKFDQSAFRTSKAREQSGERMTKTSNYQVDKRREVFIQPKVVSNQQYEQSQSGRSVEDVKQLLNNQ